MDAIVHRISAWDGLSLTVREWCDGDDHAPVLCLPGLVRTSGDFAILAPSLVKGRRVVAIDYAGRGESGRARDPRRYGPEACVRDILDICAALHLEKAVIIGTSFGGLLACALAVARPGLMCRIVLNDVGPEIGSAGADFVRDFVALDPALAMLDECVVYLRDRLPPLSLTTDDEWRAMAALTYVRGADGRFHPHWDTRIATLLGSPAPDLWPIFDATAHVPLLLVRGDVSNILLPETVARMRERRPDMEVVSLPNVGHAPTLAEPPSVAAIQRFIDRAP